MTPDAILAQKPRILTDTQRRRYFETGYLAAEGAIPADALQHLIDLSNEFIEASRAHSASNEAYDLGPNHRPDRPHVRRLRALVDRHPGFLALRVRGAVRRHRRRSGRSRCQVPQQQAELQMAGHGRDRPVAPGHPGLAAHQLQPGDLGRVSRRRAGGARSADLPAGQPPRADPCPSRCHRRVDRLGVRHRHGDPRPLDRRGSDRPGRHPDRDQLPHDPRLARQLDRPCAAVALFVYSSADAFAWMPAPTPTSKTGCIVRGAPATVAHLDPTPCPVPPDWSREGYGSIFVAQKADAYVD
ncbi:MAG: hypothetical protein WDO24_22185, partial [Pseudomonadota bacterium]